MKLSKSLRTCFGELFLYLSSSWSWRRRMFGLSILDHDALPHRGPETREPAAMNGNFSYCEPSTIISPVNCFSPASVMVTKISAPRVCTTSCSFHHHKSSPLLGGCRFGLGSLENSRTEMCVLQLIVWTVQCSLSTPRKKKARVLGSGTTAGEQIICCKPWEKDALDFLAIPCGIYKFHCCSQ